SRPRRKWLRFCRFRRTKRRRTHPKGLGDHYALLAAQPQQPERGTSMSPRPFLTAAFSAAIIALAAPVFADAPADNPTEFPPDPFPSSYHPLPSVPTLIRHVTIYTGSGAEIDDGDVLLKDGKIAGVGKDLKADAGVLVIDGTGKFVTPGIIDIHSHLGVYPSP